MQPEHSVIRLQVAFHSRTRNTGKVKSILGSAIPDCLPLLHATTVQCPTRMIGLGQRPLKCDFKQTISSEEVSHA